MTNLFLVFVEIVIHPSSKKALIITPKNYEYKCSVEASINDPKTSPELVTRIKTSISTVRYALNICVGADFRTDSGADVL